MCPCALGFGLVLHPSRLAVVLVGLVFGKLPAVSLLPARVLMKNLVVRYGDLGRSVAADRLTLRAVGGVWQ